MNQDPQSPVYQNQNTLEQTQESRPLLGSHLESHASPQTHTYTHDKSRMIAETYRLLLIALAGTVLSCYTLGNPNLSSGQAFIESFLGLGNMGFFLLFGVLATMPYIANMAIKSLPEAAAPAVLGVYGLIGGVALAPLLFFAIVQTGDISVVNQAVVLTGCAFLGASYFAKTSPESLGWTKIIIAPLAMLLFPAILINFFLGSSILGTAITYLLAALGMGQLLYSSKEIYHNPNLQSPSHGAFMLYAGLFNLFQAILSLLSRD